MIRALAFLTLFLCLGAPPAEAAIWLFGNKKQDKPAAAPQAPPKVFVAPEEKDPTKKWVLDKLFNRPIEQAESSSFVFDMKVFDKLTPEMMRASYTPKTTEELGMIAVAHNIGNQPALIQLEKDAQARIAAGEKKHEAALKKIREEQAKKMAAKMAAREAAKQKGTKAVQMPTGSENAPLKPAPKKPVLYNNDKPSLDAPKKVFKSYR